MKQLQTIILGSILTAVSIGIIFTGCADSSEKQLSKEQQELIDSFLIRFYIGQREDGSKVYSMEEQNGSRQYIIKQKDGNYKFAFATKEISDKEVLEKSQNKEFEFYYDPNNTDPNTLKKIKLFESFRDKYAQ